MIDVRCKKCNKLLAKTTIMVAAIKCPSSRCGAIFEYHIYTNTLHSASDYDTTNSEPQDGQASQRSRTPVTRV